MERQGSWCRDESMDIDEENEDEYEDSEGEDEEDGELFYASEVSALSDAYRQSSLELSFGNLVLDPPTPSYTSSFTPSGRKRGRVIDNDYL
jgi:hypothetical protein